MYTLVILMIFTCLLMLAQGSCVTATELHHSGQPIIVVAQMEHVTTPREGDPEGPGTRGTPDLSGAQREQGTPPGAMEAPPGIGSGDASSDGEPLPAGEFYGEVRSPGGRTQGSPILNSHGSGAGYPGFTVKVCPLCV